MSGDRLYDPAAETDRVIAAVLADMAGPDQRGVIVDSPPGAGKTTLVVRAAAELAACGESCIIIAQTNNQVDDLTMRLAGQDRGLLLGRLSATDYIAPAALLALPNVAVGTRLDDLGAAQVVLATAAKGETVRWQPVSPTLMRHLLAHGESRGGLGSGQRLLRYANGRPITKKRYEHLWRRLGEHLPWVDTLQVSMYWIRHILSALFPCRDIRHRRQADLRPVLFDYLFLAAACHGTT